MDRLENVLLAATVILLMVTLYTLLQTERQLDDCRFECNHLQSQLNRYEELNDLVPALYQTLPLLALAELKVIAIQIRNQKHEDYEGSEMPLIGE